MEGVILLISLDRTTSVNLEYLLDPGDDLLWDVQLKSAVLELVPHTSTHISLNQQQLILMFV